jgi:HAD superfamily hydrolase (TIGR01509 family)
MPIFRELEMLEIDAVLFDMDGVLVDTEPMLFATTNELLARRDVALEAAEYDTCRGMSEQAFFGFLVQRFDLDEDPRRLAHERLTAMLNGLAAETLLPTPGGHACLLGLAGEGLQLALASAARRVLVDLVVDKLGLRRLLGAVVTGDDVERGKPAPDLFLEAARRLGVAPARCLVVEDAVLGVEAARRAGMAVLALPPAGSSGQTHQAAGAALCLGSLAEFTPELLEQLCAADA